VTAGSDGRDFKALTDQISRARGVSCEAYKEKCLRRRIAVRMRARGTHTFDEYARLLERDPREYDLLLDALTINVTKFYRNADTWDALLHAYLPKLWESGAAKRGFRAWSAGCASGEEPYTLALVLAETIRRSRGNVAVGLSRCRVDATDVDRVSLERTRAASFLAASFSEMPEHLVRQYFSADEPRRPVEELQRIVHVQRHDLTRDPPPQPPYDVVVCRNVVIYFDRVIQERLFATFAEALVPGGLLVLGKVETLFGPARDRLILEDPRQRIYRRPA
jgi:chemotaxis methyl-accepting protein methylase